MKLILVLLVLIVGASAFAEEKQRTQIVIQPGVQLQTTEQPRVDSALDGAVVKAIGSFFAKMQKKDLDGAYNELTKGTKIGEKPEEVQALKTKTQQAIDMFGEVTGSELIGVKFVGTHLLNATYLSLGKALPLRWRFYFYKAPEGWRLIDIRVDDRLVDMFGDTPAADQRPTNWPKQ